MDTLILTNAMLFLSTLSLRRATLEQSSSYNAYLISIHALLAESDWPPVRDIIQWEDFYPRSPCGERPLKRYLAILGNVISIHALLAESDADSLTDDVSTGGFLSTLSLRRATWPGLLARPFLLISIHALLAESDSRILI